MGLDIYFQEDVERILASLDEANKSTTQMATKFGANARDVQMARYIYQSALLHVGRAFGLKKEAIKMLEKEHAKREST